MKAEILSIGSELTSGQNLDTNCQWLSRRLAEIGIPVGFHTTVADNLDDNISCFQIATQRTIWLSQRADWGRLRMILPAKYWQKSRELNWSKMLPRSNRFNRCLPNGDG